MALPRMDRNSLFRSFEVEIFGKKAYGTIPPFRRLIWGCQEILKKC